MLWQKRLEQFWSVSISTRTFFVLRLGFVALAFVHILTTLPEEGGFYLGKTGLINPEVLSFHWSTFAMNAHRFDAFRMLTFICLAGFLVGTATPLLSAAIFAFFIMLSQLFHSTGWQVDGLFCLWAMSFIFHRKYQGTVQFPGLRSMQCYLCIIYFIAAAGKCVSPDWQSGRAVQIALTSWLVTNPWDVPLLLSKFLSYSTIGAEFFIALTLWHPRLQKGAFLVAIVLHSAIFVFTKIKVFSLLMLYTHFCYAHPLIDELTQSVSQKIKSWFPERAPA